MVNIFSIENDWLKKSSFYTCIWFIFIHFIISFVARRSVTSTSVAPVVVMSWSSDKSASPSRVLFLLERCQHKCGILMLGLFASSLSRHDERRDFAKRFQFQQCFIASALVARQFLWRFLLDGFFNRLFSILAIALAVAVALGRLFLLRLLFLRTTSGDTPLNHFFNFALVRCVCNVCIWASLGLGVGRCFESIDTASGSNHCDCDCDCDCLLLCSTTFHIIDIQSSSIFLYFVYSF